MSKFHRFVDPTYNTLGGAFPGTISGVVYDRLNVTSGGVGGGDGSANADPKLPSGPNIGSYMTGFGENGKSSAVNRGIRALGENCDAIDDVLGGSIPRLTRVSFTLGAPSSSVAVTGDVFVGDFGLANTQANRNRLVHVESADGTPAVITGSTPLCTLIHDGSNANVLGQSADGFYEDVTFNFASALPAGSYVLLIGRRSSYRDLRENFLTDMISETVLRGNQSVENWSAFTHGLNERYRRATGRINAALNTPGSGAVITRDGTAPTSTEGALPPTVGYGQYKDAYQALWNAPLDAARVDATAWSALGALGGSSGYVFEMLPYNQTGTYLKGTRQHAGLLGVVPRDIRVSSYTPPGGYLPQTYLTRIGTNVSADLNPRSLNTANERATVRLGGSDYFHLAGKTAIKVDLDLLLVTVAGKTEAYVIGYIDTTYTNEARLYTLAGTLAEFPATATAATVEWVQVSVKSARAGFEVFSVSGLTDNQDGSGEIQYGVPKFFAPSDSFDDGMVNSSNSEARNTAIAAMSWGGMHRTVSSGKTYYRDNGFLLGDGSIDSAGRLRGMPSSREVVVSVAGTASLNWRPLSPFANHNTAICGNQLVVYLTAALDAALTCTINWLGESLIAGDEVTIFVENQNGCVPTIAHVLPPNVDSLVFSGEDETLPQTAGAVVQYRIRFATISNVLKGFVTRTDY